MLLAVSDNVFPEHIGLLFPATGVAGVTLIVTDVVPSGPAHPPTVTFTEYVPEEAVVTLDIVGFCEAEEKLFGPVHAYVAPVIVLAVRDKVFPEHTGLLLPGVGAAGVWLIVTETVPAGPVHPSTVAVTEYVPDAAVVTLATVGFCDDEEKPFGPVHA